MKYMKVEGHYRRHHLTGKRHYVRPHHRRHHEYEREGISYGKSEWKHYRGGLRGKIV